MKIEIERKYLVDPKRLPRLTRPHQVVQAYLSQNPEVRVRIADDKSHITVKTLGALTRKEFEYPIPLQDAQKLLKLTKLRVEKTRYFLNLDSFEWVIDFYKGPNKQLVTAEIELPDVRTKFKRPLWITKEVTYDIRYRNQSLARYPYSQWRRAIVDN